MTAPRYQEVSAAAIPPCLMYSKARAALASTGKWSTPPAWWCLEMAIRMIRDLRPEVLDEVIDSALVKRAREEGAFGPHAEVADPFDSVEHICYYGYNKSYMNADLTRCNQGASRLHNALVIQGWAIYPPD